MAAERAVARILNKDRNVAGAGVFLGPRIVLTCAHVVDEWDDWVCLDFPVQGLEPRLARILKRRPGGYDLAVLELEEPPLRIEPANWVSLNPESLNMHTFQAFGFPEQLAEGINSNYGMISGLLQGDLVQLQGRGGDGYSIAPGFSGGPVWDFDVQGVVGLAVKKLGIPNVEVAAMIPMQTILGADPDLAGLLMRGHPGADSIPARSWAVLDTRRRGRRCVTVNEMNFVLVDEVPATWNQQGLPFSAYAARSLVLSADGFVAASVAAQQLRIWTLSPRTGTARQWSKAHDLDYPNARVIAVGRKGDREVWCAIADSDRLVRRASLASNALPQWQEVGRHKQDEDACGSFVGAKLLLLENGSVVQVLPGGHKESWPPAAFLREQRIMAFDTATLESRCFTAVLARAEHAGPNGYQVVIVAANRSSIQPVRSRLETPAAAVSIIRAQPVASSHACVLVETQAAATPLIPFHQPARSAPA